MKKNQFAFTFDETKPARFGVLPRYAKDESLMQWFELSTCIIFHVGKLFSTIMSFPVLHWQSSGAYCVRCKLSW